MEVVREGGSLQGKLGCCRVQEDLWSRQFIVFDSGDGKRYGGLAAVDWAGQGTSLLIIVLLLLLPACTWNSTTTILGSRYLDRQ